MSGAHPVVVALAQLRRKRKLTQRDVAEGIGTIQSAVSEWETGTVSPSLASVQRYADLVDADIQLVAKTTTDQPPEEP
jgi:transcriptional regulator with XRE-family HTH domain